MELGVRKPWICAAWLLVGSMLVLADASRAQAQTHLPPIAIASVELTTKATDTTAAVVTLDGSNSFDPDGSVVSYRWEILTDAYDWLEITHANPLSPTATVELPSRALIERLGFSIEFRLTITDNGRPAATDSVTVEFQINQAPVIDIEVTAKLFNRDDERDIDDNRNGMVDENEERYPFEGVVHRPGEQGNSDTEWDVRAATLLVIDASGTVDPGDELSDDNFRWERLVHSDVPQVTQSLPGDATGVRMLSTDEDPNVAGSVSSETVARLPFVLGVGTEPYVVYYRLTVTDEDGLSVTEFVKIVFEDFHDDPEVEISHPESDPDAATEEDRRAGVLEAGEDRYVVSPEAAEDGITLTAVASGDGALRTAALVHRWSGTGVEPSDDNLPGPQTTAVFTIPAGYEEGDSFSVDVLVADPDGLRARESVELVVAETTAPSAVAPEDIDTPDGIDGGYPLTDPPSGIVNLRGIGFDPDGDEITYQWEQTDSRGEELPGRFRGSRILLVDADTADAPFRLPEVTRGTQEIVYVKFTVTDQWGVSDSDLVQITIRDGDDDLRARAGVDQNALPGSFVQLIGDFSSGLVSADALEAVTYQWAYRGIETDPPLGLRLAITPSERDQGFVAGEWFPDADGTYDPTAGGRLKNADEPFAYFDAPDLYDFYGVKLFFDLTVAYRDEEHTDTVAVTVIKESGLRYYSGPIDGLDYCKNQSLGGPPTYPFDSDGDGVADICAVQESRRAAVARQIAFEQLAILNIDLFEQALMSVPDDPDTEDVDESTVGACAAAPVDLGDTEEALAKDLCGRFATDPDVDHEVAAMPEPVDPPDARKFYSGTIDSAYFCANHSLGGPVTYPFDSDGDGVADTCALPYTRREAVARHNALHAAFADHPQYPAALAATCNALGTLDFGDPSEQLATDACNPAPTDFGNPLPDAGS